MTPLLAAEHVSRTLQGDIPVTLVNDVSLSVAAGELVAVTGASGSGKSSLLYLLGLLDNPSKGEIKLDGQRTSVLTGNEKSQARLEKIGFVFQFHFLLSEFSILENVMLPMRKLNRWSEREMEQRGRLLLNELGVGENPKKKPGQLSGGQRQRVAIARALANGPQLLLADEPTGNLDSKNAALVFEIFERLAKTHGTAIVAVTHEQSLAERCHRRIHMIDGKIAA